MSLDTVGSLTPNFCDISLCEVCPCARNSNTFSPLVYYYPENGMEPEIRQVMNAISKLNEDIKNLNLFEFDFNYQTTDEVKDRIKNVEKMIEELELKDRK
jgi:hypothetical protein